MTITHRKVVTTADNPTKEVSTSEWNDTHSTPATTKGDLLVRDATGLQRQGVGADGQVLTADATLANGVKWAPAAGGASWLQDVNETGASFVNFTVSTGTWASDGTTINQTDNTASAKRARYNTKIELGFGIIFEAEMRFPTAGQGAGANVQAGLLVGFDGAGGDSCFAVKLDKGAQNIGVEQDAVVLSRAFAQAIALDVFYKVRIVLSGELASIYFNGTLIGSVHLANIALRVSADFLGIHSYGSVANFRNIKAWTLRGGAPA